MRINFVTTWQEKDGIAIYSHFLVKELRKYPEIRIKIIPINRERVNPFYWINLARKAKRDCDIVHVQNEYGIFGRLGPIGGLFAPVFYLALLVNRNCNIITTMHALLSQEGMEKRNLFSRFFRKIRAKVINYFAFKSDLIIFLNNSSKKEIKNKKTKVIPHGFFRTPKFLDSQECKKKLNIPTSKQVVTIPGFVHPNKNHEMIIDEVVPFLKNTVLLIAGSYNPASSESKKYLEELKRKIKRKDLEDKVKFTGWVAENDWPLILNASDLVLLYYDKITQSGIFNVALGYCKPVLSSNIPFFQEIKRRYNCLVIAETERDILPQINKILKQSKLKEDLKSNIEKYLDENKGEAVAQLHLNAYKQVIRR